MKKYTVEIEEDMKLVYKRLKVIVTIFNKIYEIGRKESKEFKEKCPIIFDKNLGKCNYLVVSQNR